MTVVTIAATGAVGGTDDAARDDAADATDAVEGEGGGGTAPFPMPPPEEFVDADAARARYVVAAVVERPPCVGTVFVGDSVDEADDGAVASARGSGLLDVASLPRPP